MSDLLIAPTPEDLARAAAYFICTTATEAVRLRGACHIALAGGSTPLATYRALAAMPGMPWKRTHVFWGDERCVPPGHDDSNYGAAETALLAHVPIPQVQVHRIRGEQDPRAESLRYESLVRSIVGGELPRVDIILLGLGSDGHTASLFPGSGELEVTGRLVLPVVPPPYAQHARITFSLLLINAARHVVFLVSGAEKASIVARVVEGRGLDLPAGRVQPQDGRTHWMLDQAAASELDDRFRRAGRRARVGRTRQEL